MEFRTFGGMLTNVHLFFVVFFSYLSFFFSPLIFGDCPVFLLHLGKLLAIEAETFSRKTELLHKSGYRFFWRSWPVPRAPRCYNNTGSYVVTVAFSRFSPMICLTYRPSRNS